MAVELQTPITDISEKSPVGQQKILLTQESNDAIKNAAVNAIGASAENQLPVRPETYDPLAAAERSKAEIGKMIEEREKGFIDHTIENAKSFGEGVWSSQTIKYVNASLGDYAYTEELGEPDYVMSDEDFKQVTEGVPQQYWQHLEKAESLAHAARIRQRILEDDESMKRGMENPGAYIFGSVVGGVADPVAWGTGFVAGAALKTGMSAVQVRNVVNARKAISQYEAAQAAGRTGLSGLATKGLTPEVMALSKTNPVAATSLALQGRGYNKITADMLASGRTGVGLGFGKGMGTGLAAVVPTEVIQAEGDITTYDHRAGRVLTGFALGGLLGGFAGHFAESSLMKSASQGLLNSQVNDTLVRGLNNITDGSVTGVVQNTQKTIPELMEGIKASANSIASSSRKILRRAVANGERSLDDITAKELADNLPASGFTKVRMYSETGADLGKAKTTTVNKLKSNMAASEAKLNEAKAQTDFVASRFTTDEALEQAIAHRVKTGAISKQDLESIRSTPEATKAYKDTMAQKIKDKLYAQAGIPAIKRAADADKAAALFAVVGKNKAGLKASYNPKGLMETGALTPGDIKRAPADTSPHVANIAEKSQYMDMLLEAVKKQSGSGQSKLDLELKDAYDKTWASLPGVASNAAPKFDDLLASVKAAPKVDNGSVSDGLAGIENIDVADANKAPLLSDRMSRAMQSDQDGSPPVRVNLSWVNAWFNRLSFTDRTKVRPAIQFMRSLAGDTQGSTDTASKAGAMREKMVISTRIKAKMNRSYKDMFKEYQGLFPEQRANMNFNGSEFSERSFLYLDGLMPVPDNMPKMKSFVNDWRKVSDDLFNMMNNPGLLDGRTLRSVSGAEDLATKVKEYVPHVQSIAKYAAITRKHGNSIPEDFFNGYFKSRHPNLTEGELKAISRGYIQHMRRGNVIEADNGSMMLNQNSARDFVNMYIRPLGNMTEDEMASLTSKIERNLTSDNAAFGNLKSRVNIDMGYKATVRDLNGQDVELKMTDFFSTDTLAIMEKYIDKAAGSVALGRVTMDGMVNGDMTRIVNGITSESDFNRVIASIDEVAAANGVGDRSRNALIKEYKDMFDGLMGRMDPNNQGTVNDVVGYMSKMATMVISPLFIVASSSEIVKGSTIVGMEAIRNPIEKIAASLRRQSKVGDDLAQEIRDVVGLGNSNLMMHIDMPTISKYGEYLGQGGKSVAETKVSRALTRGANGSYKYSGTTGITDLFSNYMGVSITRKLIKDVVRKVEGGKASGDISGLRGKEYGFSDEIINSIYKEVKKHGRFTNGSSDFKLEKLGIEDWDPKVSHEMTMILDNVTRRAILQGDEASRRAWMNSPFAKLLLQFKSFAMYSLSKDFLFNVATRDTKGATVIAGSMAAGLLSYMSLTYLSAVGRSDRDEFLEQRLSPQAMATAALARSGAGLITTAIDTGLIFGGVDPLFLHARSSSTLNPSSHLMGQFPVIGIMDKVASTVGGGVSDLFNYGTLSRESARAGAGLIPQYFYSNMALRGMTENMKTRGELLNQ